jgi:hypothetical protein
VGRLYEIQPNRMAWNLEKPEERLLVARWVSIRPYIPPAALWVNQFIFHWFESGKSLTVVALEAINKECRRLGIPGFEVRETAASDYVKVRDYDIKSKLRTDWEDAYKVLNEKAREDWCNRNLAEIASLLPPHMTFEEFKWHREQQRKLRPPLWSERERSEREERDRRMQALENHQRSTTTLQLPAPLVQEAGFIEAQPTVEALSDAAKQVQRAMRQFAVLKKLDPQTAEGMIGEIVSRIDPDDALDIAERTDDPALIEALVTRSME